MTAVAIHEAPLKSLDRVSLQAQYLRSFASEPLAGVPAEHWRALFEPQSLTFGDSGDVENEVLAASGRGDRLGPPYSARLAAAMDGFHACAVSVLCAAANPSGSAADAPPPGPSSAYLEWTRRYCDEASGREFGFGAAGPLGLALCHQLLLFQVAGWASRAPSGDGDWGALARHVGQRRLDERRRESCNRLFALWRLLGQTPLQTADTVTHLAAMIGLWWTLRERLPDRPPNSGAGTWNDLLSQFDAEGRDVLLRLAGQNAILLAGMPEVCEAVSQGAHRPVLRGPGIKHRVQRTLRELQAFSAALVRQQDDLEVTEPLEIGRAAQDELRRFAAIRSPLLTGNESAEFSKRLLNELQSCEERLFYATVMPRPAFCDGFLRWARKRFLLTRGFHFPLSDMCLHIMLYCRNLLALQAAEGAAQGQERDRLEQACQRARQALQAPEQQLAKGTLLLGDYFVAHLALEGLRRLFGRRLCGNRDAGWSVILPRLSGQCGEGVLTLAALGPLARLVDTDLDEALDARGARRRNLHRFLDDPAGGPLKDFVAGRLVETAWSRPESMGGSVHRVLHACLEGNAARPAMPVTIEGALLAGEFFHVLLQRLFREGDAVAAAGNGQPRNGCQPERARTVASTFAGWFADLDRPVPRAVFDLLARLLEAKHAIEARTPVELDNRVLLLRQQWRALTVQTLRGLRQRPWQGRSQRLLRIHWLNFCLAIFQRFPIRPACLETGDRDFDDLATMACHLTARLYRTRRALDRQIGQWGELPDEAGAAIRDEHAEADAALIGRLLAKALHAPSLRGALLVRRLAVLDARKRLQWNVARLLEY